MSDPEISPSDPCFWLHHSNIDRIWDLWHNDHTGGPNLQGTDAVMDPWSYRTDKDRIEDTKIFGYTYE
jgi:tyrosinase